MAGHLPTVVDRRRGATRSGALRRAGPLAARGRAHTPVPRARTIAMASDPVDRIRQVNVGAYTIVDGRVVVDRPTPFGYESTGVRFGWFLNVGALGLLGHAAYRTYRAFADDTAIPRAVWYSLGGCASSLALGMYFTYGDYPNDPARVVRTRDQARSLGSLSELQSLDFPLDYYLAPDEMRAILLSLGASFAGLADADLSLFARSRALTAREYELLQAHASQFRDVRAVHEAEFAVVRHAAERNLARVRDVFARKARDAEIDFNDTGCVRSLASLQYAHEARMQGIERSASDAIARADRDHRNAVRSLDDSTDAQRRALQAAVANPPPSYGGPPPSYASAVSGGALSASDELERLERRRSERLAELQRDHDADVAQARARMFEDKILAETQFAATSAPLAECATRARRTYEAAMAELKAVRAGEEEAVESEARKRMQPADETYRVGIRKSTTMAREAAAGVVQLVRSDTPNISYAGVRRKMTPADVERVEAAALLFPDRAVLEVKPTPTPARFAEANERWRPDS